MDMFSLTDAVVVLYVEKKYKNKNDASLSILNKKLLKIKTKHIKWVLGAERQH